MFQEGQTALHIACMEGHMIIVEELLSRGASCHIYTKVNIYIHWRRSQVYCKVNTYVIKLSHIHLGKYIDTKANTYILKVVVIYTLR